MSDNGHRQARLRNSDQQGLTTAEGRPHVFVLVSWASLQQSTALSTASMVLLSGLPAQVLTNRKGMRHILQDI